VKNVVSNTRMILSGYRAMGSRKMVCPLKCAGVTVQAHVGLKTHAGPYDNSIADSRLCSTYMLCNICAVVGK
jgi:hypothetical protein